MFSLGYCSLFRSLSRKGFSSRLRLNQSKHSAKAMHHACNTWSHCQCILLSWVMLFLPVEKTCIKSLNSKLSHINMWSLKVTFTISGNEYAVFCRQLWIFQSLKSQHWKTHQTLHLSIIFYNSYFLKHTVFCGNCCYICCYTFQKENSNWSWETWLFICRHNVHGFGVKCIYKIYILIKYGVVLVTKLR